MSKFCKITFSSEKHYEYSGDSSNNFSVINRPCIPATDFQLVWRLNDSQAASHFYDIISGSKAAPSRIISWNFYDNSSGSKTELEAKIEFLNDQVSKVMSKMKVASTPYILAQHEMPGFQGTLNEIHYFFEKNLGTVLSYDFELAASFEVINKLIHQIENLIASKDSAAATDYFYVLRSLSENNVRIPLTEADFETFDLNTTNGSLILDSFILGKDLQNAYHSDDTELIKNHEVRTQEYITGSVNFSLNSSRFNRFYSPVEIQAKYDAYYAWCETSHCVENGYEYTRPQNNLGHIVLGKLMTTDFDSTVTSLKSKPYVIDMEVYEK